MDKAIQAKVSEVASLLGYSVEFVYDEARLWLDDDEISIANRLGRLLVSGKYPRAKDGSVRWKGFGTAKTITLAEKKTAHQIAKEMGWRFLPAHKETMKEFVRLIEEYELRLEKQREVLTKLATTCGVPADKIYGFSTGELYAFDCETTAVTIHVRAYGDQIGIELKQMSLEVANNILRYLWRCGNETADE